MPSVSAIVLTKDSQRTIEACIKALLPAVDHVIVVDTGSTDDTVRIAKDAGAHVYHFEWRDDFAAARNFGDSLATTDWVIHVDSDEILRAEDAGKIRKLCAQYRKTTTHTVVLVQQINMLGDRVQLDPVPRLYKRGVLVWRGILHEQLVAKRNEQHSVVASDIGLIHDGYNPSVVDLDRKYQRNISTLRDAVSKDPSNAAYNFFLGRDLFGNKQYAESIIYLETAYNLGKQDSPSLPQIGITLHHAYNESQDPTNAEDVLRRLTKDRPEHPDAWFLYGIHVLRSSPENMQTAAEHFQMARQTGTAYHGVSGFDPDIGPWKANYWLGMLAQASGNSREAQHLYREVLKINPNIDDVVTRLQQIQQQLGV